MARRRGPFRRVSLLRLGVAIVIVATAVLAFTLQAGVFRLVFRAALVVGAVVLIGSYLLEWWLRRRGRV